MKPEKQDLIGDLLDGGTSREATLLAGARILRRRRFWRAARRGAAATALVAIGVTLFLRNATPPSPRMVSVAPKMVPAPVVQALTDDELLALFPKTPVALASSPDGKKRLIFPRPGDEKKFITRL